MKYLVLLLAFLCLVWSVNEVFAAEHKIVISKGSTSTLCQTFHNCYVPEKISIRTGDKISWVNEDSEIHTVTSGKPGVISSIFDSQMIKPGQSWSFVFEDPQTIDYFCTLHPWMMGQIAVIGQKTQQPITIPQWVRNNAKWWSEGTISDTDFINGIQFLIQKEIIKISHISQKEKSEISTVPQWIKNNARWWANGTITDEDFTKGIQFLIENGIIKIHN